MSNFLSVKKVKRLRVFFAYQKQATKDRRFTLRELERALNMKRATITRYFNMWS